MTGHLHLSALSDEHLKRLAQDEDRQEQHIQDFGAAPHKETESTGRSVWEADREPSLPTAPRTAGEAAASPRHDATPTVAAGGPTSIAHLITEASDLLKTALTWQDELEANLTWPSQFRSQLLKTQQTVARTARDARSAL